jgi:hypothetical protein
MGMSSVSLVSCVSYRKFAEAFNGAKVQLAVSNYPSDLFSYVSVEVHVNVACASGWNNFPAHVANPAHLLALPLVQHIEIAVSTEVISCFSLQAVLHPLWRFA